MENSQKTAKEFKIYGNLDFIGFSFALEHNQYKAVGLLLFETLDDVLIQQLGFHIKVQIESNDIETITLLMRSSISTFDTNDIEYTVIDENGKQFILRKKR